MKKLFLFILCALSSFIFLSSCDEEGNVIEVQAITLSQHNADMKIGDSLALRVTVSPRNASYDYIDWTTSDRKVASVNSEGVVTANGYGKCQIAASVNGLSDYCEIAIIPPPPTISWESNSGFAQVELVDGLDAVVTATVPGKFLELKLVLGLGNYNILANPYIQLSSNKGGSSNPVMDMIADASCVSFAKGLGMSVGQTLQDRTEAKLDLKAILEKILQGQFIENNTTFTIEVRIVDQLGNTATKTAKFHFTAAPVISWTKNSTFATVDLDAAETECKVDIWAPGKIEKLLIKVTKTSAPTLLNYVRNRTSGQSSATDELKIDLIEDPKVAESFKGWFPAGDAVKGKDKVTLDFGFMYNLKYDLEASTNVFTIVVEDKNGKTAYQQVLFKKY